ncbi:hypothetical protein Zmor_026896 [Zophobas morio]|uniref:Elongation of very long chain fatty acids protein n=1 Tax=Zophobas morio TaxID=2755281 RepID=A0AA38M5J3_9CUCU|nr:hypothetical protein Zmor_026896 [Zophobas morio]
MFFTTFVSFFDSYSLGTTNSDIDNHLFLDSPVNVITVLLAYVLFIFKWGPQIMKSREPFNLKTLMIIYNVVQVFLNLILFIMAARLMPNFSAYCSPANISHTATDVAIRKVHYYYVLLKFIDFFDTVFFILRKKHSQISLLHLHHHIGIASTTWVTLKTIPGGVAMFVFLVNTFVHVIMYLYYLINLLDRTKTMWWKKHLTQLQLLVKKVIKLALVFL